MDSTHNEWLFVIDKARDHFLSLTHPHSCVSHLLAAECYSFLKLVYPKPSIARPGLSVTFRIEYWWKLLTCKTWNVSKENRLRGKQSPNRHLHDTPDNTLNTRLSLRTSTNSESNTYRLTSYFAHIHHAVLILTFF